MGENWANAVPGSCFLVPVSALIQAVLFLSTVLIRPRPLAFPGTCFLSVCDQNVLAGLGEGIVPGSASWCGDVRVRVEAPGLGSADHVAWLGSAGASCKLNSKAVELRL